jgi:putative AdoMet-dependent methyltransferase
MSVNRFNAWAECYDESMRSDSKHFPFIGYYQVLERVIALVNPTPKLDVLDIGIGTGVLCKNLRTLGCKIYGVDFSQKMLDVSKERIPDGVFYRADVSNLNFLERLGKFDRIVSTYFFHHLTNNIKVKLIENLFKNHIKENGKIIIADVGFKTRSDLEKAGKIYSSSWDSSEHYLCAEELTDILNKKKISSNYTQISDCAGILIIKTQQC